MKLTVTEALRSPGAYAAPWRRRQPVLRGSLARGERVSVLHSARGDHKPKRKRPGPCGSERPLDMQHLPHRQESGSSRDLRSLERNAPTAELVERNIAALLSRRAADEQALGWQERLAGVITTLAGSMAFV